MDKINIYEKLNLFNEYWSPKILGEVNDAYVKVVKLKGEFLGTAMKMKMKCFTC